MYHTSTVGDALVVELLPGRLLFVLLTEGNGGGGDWQPVRLLGAPSEAGMPFGIMSISGGLMPVRFDDLPMMVTFTNVADERTAILVDPKNVAATFGPDVSLVGASVERTNAHVSRSVKERLPWLAEKIRKQGWLASGTIRSSPGKFYPNVRWFTA